MDFLKEFSRQFSGKGRSAAEKSKEEAEYNRLSAGLGEAQAALDELYARYGRACYAVREGRGSPEATRELALRIRAAIMQVEELTAARDAARELKRCLNCGAVFGREARFCSACGKPRPVRWFCPDCGTENHGAFCVNCGRKKPI